MCVNHRVEQEQEEEVGGICALLLSDWLSGLFGGVSRIGQEVQAEMTSSLQEHME